MNPRSYMVLALLLFLTGCASSQGLHLGSLQQTLQDEEARFVGALPSISTANPSTRQGPPKLGLYVMPTGFLHHEFEWTDADRESLLAWTNGLEHLTTKITKEHPGRRFDLGVPRCPLWLDLLRRKEILWCAGRG